MKKSAIALAVAASLAASAAVQAETTLYGRLCGALTYTDSNGFDDDPDNTELDDFFDGSWDVISSCSRFGIRGSEDLGNGLSAIYHFETALNSAEFNGDGDGFTGRLAYVGLQGGFGAVKIGSQWTPYYNALGVADIFNEIGWYSFYQGPFRQNDAILYETPASISAFKGEAMIVLDGPSAFDDEGDEIGDDNVDIYDIGASFNIGPAYVGAAYRQNEATDNDQWGIAASVDFAGVSIAALYEDYDSLGRVPITNADSVFGEDSVNTGLEGKDYALTAQYAFGNNIVKAGFARVDLDDLEIDGAEDIEFEEIDQWALGFQHNLSSRTRVWVEYTNVDYGDIPDADDDDDDDIDTDFVTLGIRHDF